jgi:OmcA/MtrC family decaheme c-type cytochrome
MIHRIHTGEELRGDESVCAEDPNAPECYTIYGRSSSVHNYDGILYPGDRRICEDCHINDSQQVLSTLPPGRLDTPTPRDRFTPQRPRAAACLGCHDSQAAAAHAFVNTAPFGEACASCHGPNAEFSVDKVHAH